MNKYIYTILFVIIASLILANFTNRSNFPKVIMIPLIVGGLTKYVVGDWDKKFSMELFRFLLLGFNNWN